MNCTISPREAATATAQILGYYPTIPASDPKAFAAGLVKTLSTFPAEVVARAVDPVDGIPGRVAFLNLAEIRKLLDAWRGEHFTSLDRIERANRQAIAAPAPDTVADERIAKGLRELSNHLKSGFSPASV